MIQEMVVNVNGRPARNRLTTQQKEGWKILSAEMRRRGISKRDYIIFENPFRDNWTCYFIPKEESAR